MFDVDRNQSNVRLSMSLMPPDSTEFKKKERSIMSTGDILSPRKQAVMDRLRRRFDRYRAHQFSCLPRYNLNLNGLIDQQHQETRNLRQRFLETKTKKSNKKSEPKSKSGLSAGLTGGGGGNESSGAGGAIGNSGSVNNSLGGVNSVSSGSGSNSASNPSAGSGAGSQNSNASLNGPQAKYKRTAEDSSSPLGCSRSASGQKNDTNMSSGVSSSGNNNKTNLGKSNLTQISAEFEFSSPGQQIQMNVKVTTVASNNIKTSGSPAPSTGPSVVSSNSGNGKSTTTVIDSNSESNGGNASVRAVSKTVVNNNNNNNASSGVGIEKSEDDDHQDNKIGYQISCKQEPELDLGSCGVTIDCPGNGASHSFTEFTNFDLNEDALKAFMEDWTSEDMNPIDLMNLEKFEDSVDPFRSDHTHLHGLTDPQQHHQVDKSGIDGDNRNLGQLPPYPVGNNQGGNQVLPMFPVSSSSDSITLNLLTNMNNSTMRPPSYTTQTTLGGLDFLAKETSPAAQTLKQMAEQHQQQRQQQHLSNIGLNTSSPFSSDFNQFGGAGNTNGNSVSMDFLSSTSGGCFLPKSGSGPLFSFDSNPLASSAGVNKNSETLYRPTQRFHLPTHLQEAGKNQMNQQRTTEAKIICSGNNSNGVGTGGVVNSGPTQNLLTGHCSPDLSCNSATTGSPLTFVGTKPLSHFGDSGQANNNNSPNNGTRQYVRTSGGPTQQQPQQQLRSSGGASSPSSNANLRQQRHHFMGMSSSQNGHHLQVSQGPHANVTSDQQPVTMFNYGQPAPQGGTSSGNGDHFQLSLSQSQAMTFSGANGASIANPGTDRMVSVNQTTVVQLSSGGPPLNMLGHHSQLLRPATMQNQLDQPQQQQQQMMQMQMEKRKLSQQQVRNNHSGMTQFGARPPPPDYGTQMNLMSGPPQQQQSSPVMMPGVIGSQPGQLLINNSSINNRVGSGSQPRLASALNVGSGGRLPMMNNRNGQQINLGMSGNSGVPVNVSGRFLGDDTRPPNVEIGPDGLSIGMRSSGESAGDWRQKINHNQHPSAKFQGANLCQMGGVNPRFSGQILAEQRGMQSNNVDNVQMISMQQQQQQLNMINRIGSGVVNNCSSQSSLGTVAHHQHHHPHHQLNHHQQMPTMMQQQQQSNSNLQQQSVNAHLMSQMSSSVVASAGSNFLSGDPSSRDFNDFFESGGFEANDLLNSFELDIQNGNL